MLPSCPQIILNEDFIFIIIFIGYCHEYVVSLSVKVVLSSIACFLNLFPLVLSPLLSFYPQSHPTPFFGTSPEGGRRVDMQTAASEPDSDLSIAVTNQTHGTVTIITSLFRLGSIVRASFIKRDAICVKTLTLIL